MVMFIRRSDNGEEFPLEHYCEVMKNVESFLNLMKDNAVLGKYHAHLQKNLHDMCMNYIAKDTFSHARKAAKKSFQPQ